MNFEYWNEEWQARIKLYIVEVLKNESNEMILGYDRNSRVDFDEWFCSLFDDNYFNEFIVSYKEKFSNNSNIIKALEKLKEELLLVDKETKVTYDLLKNQRWDKIRGSVNVLIKNGF